MRPFKKSDLTTVSRTPKSMEERHRSISNPSKRKGNGDDPTAGLLGNSLSNDVWAEKKEHGQCVFGIMPL